MPERRSKDGVVYERTPNGQWSVVGYENAPMGGMDPRDQIQSATVGTQIAQAGASLDNTRTNIVDTAADNSRADTAQGFNFTAELRKEFNALDEVKNYQTVMRQYASALKTQPNPSGDQALITAYAKMLDPGSVVREQEFAVTADADSAIGKLEARLKKELGLDGAGRFRPEIRNLVRMEMRNLADGYGQSYGQARQRYASAADGYGINPVQVIGPDIAQPFKKDIDAFWAQNPTSALGQDQTGVAPIGGLAPAGAESKAIPIPPEMQAEYEAYVQQNRGRINPDDYARFRIGLADKYGFGSNDSQFGTFAAEADRINKDALGGGTLNLQIPLVDAAMSVEDRVKTSMLNSPEGAFLAGAVDFHGGMDELAAGASSLFRGTPYDIELARANATKQAIGNENPVASELGKITGAIGAGVATGGLAPGLGAAAATPWGAPLLGAGFGAAQGALESNDARGMGGLAGGLAGAAGGAIGRKAAPLISDGIDMLRGAPRLTGGERAVAGALPPDAIAAARQNITDAQSYDLPFVLADADPKLRALAGSATRRSPEALANAEPMLERRGLGQVERATGAIDNYLTPTANLAERAKQLRDAGSIESAPKYAEAFAQPAPDDPRIAAMLATPSGRDALNRARTIAADAQRGGFSLDQQGNAALGEGAPFETLDMVKKGFDARIQENANPITGNVDFAGRPDLQAIEGLRSRFVGALDESNPTYKDARGTYTPYAQQAEALGMGNSARARNVPLRDLERATGGLTPEALGEFRTGYATGLSDDAMKASLGSNPYKTIFGSGAQQEKIGSLFPEGAQDLGRISNLEDAMAKTSQEVLAGSPTARRQAADAAFEPSMMGNVAQDATTSAISGVPLPVATARAAVRNWMEGTKFGVGNRGADKANEIADLLLSQNPELIDVFDRASQKALRADEIRRRLSLVGPMAIPALVPAIGQ